MKAKITPSSKLYLTLIVFAVFAMACGGAGQVTPKKVATLPPMTPVTFTEEEATVEEAPATVEEAPATVEEAPATVEEAPATVEETPATVEEVVDDVLTIVEEAQIGTDVYEIGDVIEVGDTTLTVMDFFDVKPDEYFKPSDGNKFVAVDLVFENRGTEDKIISTLLQMSLKGGDHRKYTVDIAAAGAMGGVTLDGALAPGETVRGTVGFQIPVDSTGMEFVFNDDITTLGKLSVNLK